MVRSPQHPLLTISSLNIHVNIYSTLIVESAGIIIYTVKVSNLQQIAVKPAFDTGMLSRADFSGRYA